MNCWIILLLLCCCGKNNNVSANNIGCGCDCHEHCDNHNTLPRMWERESCICNARRERECDCEDYDHDSCDCSDDERVREKWTPYKDYNDNDRRDCNCR
ncbi:MAG: hypothetical protein IKK33_05640 [Lachnospiraceae bacterium]|nr:hypothetical protein [Lachnospiraceae bacterium]